MIQLERRSPWVMLLVAGCSSEIEPGALTGSVEIAIETTHDRPTASYNYVTAKVQLDDAVYFSVVENILLPTPTPEPGLLYGVTQCCPNEFVQIDLVTGAFTHVSDVGDASTGFQSASAIDRATHRFFVARPTSTPGGPQHELAIIDTQTGSLGTVPVAEALGYLGFDSVAAELYALTYANGAHSFARIDTTTGDLTTLSQIPVEAVVSAATTIDSGGHRLFFAFSTSGDPGLGTVLHHLGIIDTQTGAFTDVPLLDFGMPIFGFDALSGQLYGVTALHGSPGANDFAVIDATTGVLTLLNNVGGTSFGFAGTFAVDPHLHRFFLERRTGANAELLLIDAQTGAITWAVPLARPLVYLVAE